jgi:zinc protease
MLAINRALLLVIALLPAALLATPAIERWQTANGAQVLFVAAPALPMVDIRITFDAGSAREPRDRGGLARLVNGLLNEGVGEGAQALDATAIATAFESVGAEFSNESLRDMATLSLRSLTRAELLQPAVALLARLVHEPAFTPAAIERVRDQMRAALRHEQQSASESASRALYAALYGDHPYGHSPNGDEATLAAITREDLFAFYRRYYVANNALVAIVGAVSREQAAALAEEVVGRLPLGEGAGALPAVAMPAPLARKIPFASSQSHLLLGLPVLSRHDADYFPLFVGNHILGGSGLVSRISEEVREQRGLAYSAYSYFSPMRAAGPFIVGAQTRHATAMEAQSILRQSVSRFIAEGPSEAELVAARRNLVGSFALNTDSNREILAYLALIGFYGLPLDWLDTYIARIEAVSVASIRDAFARRVDTAKMVTIHLGGE